MEYIIKNKIEELIAKGIVEYGNSSLDESTRDSIRIKLELHRAIKNELTKAEKKNGKEITPEEELKILLGMKAQREESWKIYKDAGRWDLANKENMEAEIISHILPVLPTNEDIELYTKGVIELHYNGKCEMKNMKDILAEVKKKYPSADGKIVSSVVKQYV
jgi:uncharacterized protein YqeY